MKKLSLVLVLLIILESLCLTGIPVFATDAVLEGNGTEASPYLIGGYDELIAFRDKVNSGETTACATLTADIALSGNWTAIGTAENKYSGSFDGNGYMITSIKGAGSNDSAWGLFAYTNGGEIKNLTVSTGSDNETAIGHQAALIVGIASNNTKITKCAGYGNISGWGYIGGITYDGDCVVTDCYYVGDIKGAHNVTAMGLKATVTNCYAYSNITADTHAFRMTNKSATNSYFLNAAGAQGTGGYGTQKSADAFASGEVACLLGEAFGQTIGIDKYPVFKTENNTVYENSLGGYSNSESEDGSADKPYTIANTAALNAFRNLVNAGNVNLNAKLCSDINLKNATWTPIGTTVNKFAGTFDGNGFKISGINGKGSNDSAWGFFAYTNGGEIKNLTVSTGSDNETAIGHQAALIVGIASNGTKITKCAGYGNVSGWGYIGGITYDGDCVVTDCYYVGDIKGAHNVTAMGLKATVTNCYAYSNITADTHAFRMTGKSATNSYFLNAEGAQGTGGYGTQKSAETFTSGEVAYLLGEEFGQRFGEDEYPVFKSDDNTVYFKDGICYTNNNMEDGTTENPYTIDNYTELGNFRTAVNNGKTSIAGKLMADIDLKNALWTPIGTNANKFAGTIDGNGFKISGINGSGTQWGFCAYTNGGEIKNLTIEAGNNEVINAGHQSALIVGVASNDTKITNCAGIGNISVNDGFVGGINSDGACIVTNCYFVGDVTGVIRASAMGYDAKAYNCFAYGNITATKEGAGCAFKISNNKATTNCYYLASSGVAGTGGYGTQKSADAFASGEVAYLLNKGAGKIIYGQTVVTDTYPTTAKDTVIYKKLDGTYSNTEGTFVSLNDSEAVVIASANATAFIAQYGAKGELKKANLIPLKAGDAYETEITLAEGATNARIYVWDSATNLKPIAEVEGYTFN